MKNISYPPTSTRDQFRFLNRLTWWLLAPFTLLIFACGMAGRSAAQPVPPLTDSISALTKLCFSADPPKPGSGFKELTEGCSSLSTAIKNRVDSEQAVEKGSFDRAQIISADAKKVALEKKKEDTRQIWAIISFIALLAMNFALIVSACILWITAYRKTDIATLFKESSSGKWSFSRIIGFSGGCFTFLLFLFIFDMSLAHLFFLGTMPDQFAIYAGTVGTLLVSQIPYIINKVSGKD
jgi:hypothetical protein